MKIVSKLTVKEVETLDIGTIINWAGDVVIVTDAETENFNDMCVVSLTKGTSESVDLEELLHGINDPDQPVKIVKESTLTIEEYL